MHGRRQASRIVRAALCGSLLAAGATASAQPAAPGDQGQHDPGTHTPAPQAPGPPASPIDVPHGREGSGTAWLPDASPMYAVHWQAGEWEAMAHGNLFLQFLADGGYRGEDQFGSINWGMAMARRPIGEGRLQLRGMLSFEPWTIRGCGYPDLLASGEVCGGEPIVDRQHPHDLFMELAARYERPLTASLGLQLYAGLAGEPALGPVAYPHRISAMSNPLAPISHHWMDASHITFGVLTGGVFGQHWKAEASLFNGREPDEDRYDLDFGALDSFSGRFWYLPTEHLALQVSAGRLAEAEEPHAGELHRPDVNRVTASATFHRPFRGGGSLWASTLAWGRNTEEGEWTGFLMAETNVTYDEQDSWFGRLEVGDKHAHDLHLHGTEETFTLGKFQAGYVRYLEVWNGLKPGFGATLTMSLVPNALETLYGRRATLGVGAFLTLRPAAMAAGMDPHAGHR